MASANAGNVTIAFRILKGFIGACFNIGPIFES